MICSFSNAIFTVEDAEGLNNQILSVAVSKMITIFLPSYECGKVRDQFIPGFPCKAKQIKHRGF